MSVQLSRQDIGELKKQGFTETEINKAIMEIEKGDLQKASSSFSTGNEGEGLYSPFQTKPDNDIVKWQLELNDLLERTEHILRGDIVKYENNQTIWKENPQPEHNSLNNWGVQEIMRILSLYINRNTILSDYKRDDIKYKVYDFARELNDIIFMRYEELGMDTEDKRKEYPIIVNMLKDVVHSAYNRALEGGERRSLREMIQISQTSQMAQNPMQSQVSPAMAQQQRSVMNPLRYLQGKWK